MANTQGKKEIIQQSYPQIVMELVKLSRPIHWTKNLSIFAALLFSGGLFIPEMYSTIILAFFSFSFTASATYIFNDIFDVKLDRLHPIKKKRPIAAGKVSVPASLLMIVALLTVSFFIASKLNTLFTLTLIAYLSIQALYSLGLKKIPVIDILIIASGFILRVYAGAFVIDAHLSVWFLLCVISVALFLAAGKRRAEQGTLPEGKTRVTLTKYKRELLNSYVTMFGNAAWMSWALFTFFESPPPTTPIWLFLAEISRTTTISKLLMITIPVVIFGIMRYEALIFEDRSESPESLLLKDRALVISVLLWVFMVVAILYGGTTAYT
jgi:4-hydroxybenzoate polyprenyltransferase